jgi:small multidrug resistance pump
MDQHFRRPRLNFWNVMEEQKPGRYDSAHKGCLSIITVVATWGMILTSQFQRSIRQEPAMQWLFLSIAIISEVMATSALKSSNGFTQLWPSLVVVAGYAAAFFFLSLTLRTIPVGIAYAIWSGAGIVLITLIAWLVLGQTLDGPAIVGLALIVAGVVVLNIFSKSAIH